MKKGTAEKRDKQGSAIGAVSGRTSLGDFRYIPGMELATLNERKAALRFALSYGLRVRNKTGKPATREKLREVERCALVRALQRRGVVVGSLAREIERSKREEVKGNKVGPGCACGNGGTCETCGNLRSRIAMADIANGNLMKEVEEWEKVAQLKAGQLEDAERRAKEVLAVNQMLGERMKVLQEDYNQVINRLQSAGMEVSALRLACKAAIGCASALMEAGPARC